MLSAGVFSCTPGDPPRDEPPSPTVEPTEPAPDDPAVPATYDRLLAKARADGQVAVIVSLRLDSTPAAKNAYSKAIAEAIERMHDELERFGFQPGHAYKTRPMFAAQVDVAALRYLIESDAVDQISEDALEHPE